VIDAVEYVSAYAPGVRRVSLTGTVAQTRFTGSGAISGSALVGTITAGHDTVIGRIYNRTDLKGRVED
jgi:hypothetical protein